MLKWKTSFHLQIASQIDPYRPIAVNLVIVLSNWPSFPVGRIQLIRLSAISIQTQKKTAIQLPIHPQPHLDWPMSSSLWSCSLQRMEKRYSSFFWNALWSANRRATRNTVLSTSSRISIETLKTDDMELINFFMFFLTWVFRMQCRAKIRKPCSIKMISRSLNFTICKRINQMPLGFSERKENVISYD